MPQRAWSNWAEMRAFSDCTIEALDNPDLGEYNVTIPDYKTLELRWYLINFGIIKFDSQESILLHDLLCGL